MIYFSVHPRCVSKRSHFIFFNNYIISISVTFDLQNPDETLDVVMMSNYRRFIFQGVIQKNKGGGGSETEHTCIRYTVTVIHMKVSVNFL